MKSLILIFLGGGIGSVLRFMIGKLNRFEFSYGTLIANILGCLLLGIVIGLFKKELVSNSLFLLFAVGFCGGFTTFSTFSLELFELLKNDRITLFFIYLLASILLGLFCIFIGIKLSETTLFKTLDS